MSITDRRDGLTRDVAVKRPVRVAATANLILSGLQIIDDVTLGAGDANLRVLARPDRHTRERHLQRRPAWPPFPQGEGKRRGNHPVRSE